MGNESDKMDDELTQILEMIEEFSDKYLDVEFKALNVKLAGELGDCDKISFDDDKPEVWAAGIIFAIGQLNFLFEDLYAPYISRNNLCGYFKISRMKMNNKARDIRRLLNLKLGDKNFSTEFISTLKIPKSDVDLKRIRTFDEVKREISRRPKNVDDLNNSELQELIDRAIEGDEDCLDDMFLLLRKTFFIRLYSDNKSLQLGLGDGKFMIPVFTNKDKCKFIFDNVQLDFWPFINVIDIMGNKNFKGVVINPKTDDFLITKEMMVKVYPNRDKYNYWNIFFLR